MLVDRASETVNIHADPKDSCANSYERVVYISSKADWKSRRSYSAFTLEPVLNVNL